MLLETGASHADRRSTAKADRGEGYVGSLGMVPMETGHHQTRKLCTPDSGSAQSWAARWYKVAKLASSRWWLLPALTSCPLFLEDGRRS